MGKKFLREYSDEEYCEGLDTSAYNSSDADYDELMDGVHSYDEYEDLMGERMPEDEIERRIDNDDFVRNNIYKNISEKRKKYSTMKITESQLRQIIRESVETIMNEGLKDKAKNFWNKCQQFCDDEPVQKKRGTIGDAEGADGNVSRAEKKIKSMVKEAISELSRDTMDSAADGAAAAAYNLGYNTPERKKREEQYRTFSNGVNKTVGDNPRAQLRLDQERKARRNGTRTYKDGKWTYNDAQR